MALETAPSCIIQNVPPDVGTVAPYVKSLDGFYTLGPGGVLNVDNPHTSPSWLGASNGTIALVIIGFVVFLVVMVMWVRFEDGRLNDQAARLRAAGVAPAPEML